MKYTPYNLRIKRVQKMPRAAPQHPRNLFYRWALYHQQWHQCGKLLNDRATSEVTFLFPTKSRTVLVLWICYSWFSKHGLMAHKPLQYCWETESKDKHSSSKLRKALGRSRESWTGHLVKPITFSVKLIFLSLQAHLKVNKGRLSGRIIYLSFTHPLNH